MSVCCAAAACSCMLLLEERLALGDRQTGGQTDKNPKRSPSLDEIHRPGAGRIAPRRTTKQRNQERAASTKFTGKLRQNRAAEDNKAEESRNRALPRLNSPAKSGSQAWELRPNLLSQIAWELASQLVVVTRGVGTCVPTCCHQRRGNLRPNLLLQQ